MTRAGLAEVKARHQREHEARCEWTFHGVSRRERADGTTELTLEGSRYPTRAERQAGAADDPRNGTLRDQGHPHPGRRHRRERRRPRHGAEHCGARYTVVWQGRGWTVELSSTYPLWTVQG